jgi:hypothetical protein
MGLRELKETAHQQFVRGKFTECARTYQRILRLAPRDPNMHVRHAEVCRRTGERQQAISSYRTAAELLLELGCATRARGALKAALELDPKDPVLQADIARLDSNSEELFSASGSGELPLLPPLESGLDPVPPPAAPSVTRATRPEDRLRTTALPPIQRALPSAQHIGPPILLPPPGAHAESTDTSAPSFDPRVEKLGADMANAAATVTPVAQPRAATPGYRPLPPRAKSPPPAPRQMMPSGPPPVLHPVDSAPLPSRAVTTSPQGPCLQPGASLPPRSATMGSQSQAARTLAPPVVTPRAVSTGHQASPLGDAASHLRAASSASCSVVVPPPPPAEALIEAVRDVSLAQLASAVGAAASSCGSVPRLEVRRLSPSALALRSSPNDGWAVIRSHTPLEIHLVEELEKLPPMMQDLPAEITLSSEAEGASSTLH